MPGLYIHIPFCRNACNYCNFHFSVSRKNQNGFVNALKNELVLTKGFFDKNKKVYLDSIYFGGGTPSVLNLKEIEEILKAISEEYYFDNNTEITLEANPDDLSTSKLKGLKDLSINRLSIGVQSFHDKNLKYLNRIHNKGQAVNSIVNAQKAGFENITIDLIYGIPNLTNDDWVENLEMFKQFNVPHISFYALTIEDKTPLKHYINQGKAKGADDEQASKQFEIIREWVDKNNFIHYEISNAGKQGYLSRHNISYWTGSHYLGVGPSAHSFKTGKRFWNISNTSKYIENLSKGKLLREEETLSINQEINEYIMTSLRTKWGCDLNLVSKKYGASVKENILKSADRHIQNEYLVMKDGNIFLSKKAMFFADGIASDLFIL